jgi:hypothetical protein
MKTLGFMSLFCALALTSSVASADHTDPVGSVGRLEHESRELQREVSYTNLNYNVKRAVSDFDREVFELVNCVEFGFRDHTDHVGCPQRCGYQLRRTQTSFQEVARYLRDTQYDYPYVYDQYQHTSRALRSIYLDGQGPGPGPNPTTYRCVAKDSGWEEHFGGHPAYGRTLIEAQRNALSECQRHHGRCLIQSCN